MDELFNELQERAQALGLSIQFSDFGSRWRGYLLVDERGLIHGVNRKLGAIETALKALEEEEMK